MQCVSAVNIPYFFLEMTSANLTLSATRKTFLISIQLTQRAQNYSKILLATKIHNNKWNIFPLKIAWTEVFNDLNAWHQCLCRSVLILTWCWSVSWWWQAPQTWGHAKRRGCYRSCCSQWPTSSWSCIGCGCPCWCCSCTWFRDESKHMISRNLAQIARKFKIKNAWKTLRHSCALRL